MEQIGKVALACLAIYLVSGLTQLRESPLPHVALRAQAEGSEGFFDLLLSVLASG